MIQTTSTSSSDFERQVKPGLGYEKTEEATDKIHDHYLQVKQETLATGKLMDVLSPQMAPWPSKMTLPLAQLQRWHFSVYH